MAAAERFAIAALLALVVSGLSARAQDATYPAHIDTANPAHVEAPNSPHVEAPHPAHNTAEHACLNQKERQAETESGRLIRLSMAIHMAKRRMPGAVVQARLCRGHDGLVYVLTVLAHDGKVASIAVDALKGTYAGAR
jgi:uncharacterized membrane protein YkoI